MIDLLSTMQVLLRDAGFVTRLASIEQASIVCFEDDDLLGFGLIFEDPGVLLTRWLTMETSLLRRYAPTFRGAREKAWNVYCVFLCASAADPSQTRQVRWLEENLDRTRKIAACGLTS